MAGLSPVEALRLIREVVEDSTISASEARVIIGLITRADNDTGIALFSWRKAARSMNVSTKTISRAVNRLKQVGLHKVSFESINGESAVLRKALSSGKRYPTESAALSRGKRARPQGENHTSPIKLALETSAIPPIPPKGGDGLFDDRVPAERLPFLETDLREIYAAYPRHVGPRKAMEAIGRALIRVHQRNGVEDVAAWMLERVRLFSASPKGRAGQFTPHPATWFNQDRFDDDPKEWQVSDDHKGPMTAAYRGGQTDWAAVQARKAGRA